MPPEFPQAGLAEPRSTPTLDEVITELASRELPPQEALELSLGEYALINGNLGVGHIPKVDGRNNSGIVLYWNLRDFMFTDGRKVGSGARIIRPFIPKKDETRDNICLKFTVVSTSEIYLKDLHLSASERVNDQNQRLLTVGIRSSHAPQILQERFALYGNPYTAFEDLMTRWRMQNTSHSTVRA